MMMLTTVPSNKTPASIRQNNLVFFFIRASNCFIWGNNFPNK